MIKKLIIPNKNKKACFFLTGLMVRDDTSRVMVGLYRSLCSLNG